MRGLRFLVIVLLCASSAASAGPAPGLRIGRITVLRANVFDPARGEDTNLVYKLADRIHVRTREAWIRRELLFHEGGPYDPALLAETERNLRSFAFIRKASVEASPPNDGAVDVTVRVQDSWTLELQASFSRQGGRNAWKTGVVERNLLGTGRYAAAIYDRQAANIHRIFVYRDPHLLRRHLELSGDYIESADGKEYGAALERPFYASTARWSAGTSGSVSDMETAVYSRNTEIGRAKTTHRQGAAFIGRSFSDSPERLRRLKLGYRHQSDDFESAVGPIGGDLPADRELGVLELGAQWRDLDFIKLRHIEKFDRDEDFDVGARLDLTLGGAPRWLGSTRGKVLTEASVAKGWRPSETGFALARAGYTAAMLGERDENLVWNVDLQAFSQALPQQTLAAHAAYHHGSNLDPDKVLILGEGSGLRGYSENAFSGDRRAVLNIEDRLFLADDVWHLLSFGLVGFLDSGLAWMSPARAGLTGLRSAAGLGLRVAFSRSSRNEPIRVDLAYALNDNGRKSRFVLSVQAGKAFTKP